MPGLGSAAGIGAAAGAVGDLFGGIFGGIADFQQAKGYTAEAGAYSTAKTYALQNALISQEAGAIKMEQTDRAIYKTIGQQKAGYAAGGLDSSGSAQAVLRNSVSQGALEKAIVNEQTQINVTGYKSQAAQFAGMSAAATSAASAAKTSGTGSIIGGIFSAVTSIIPFLSDPRLKTDIELIDMHDKLGIYRYRFHGEDQVRTGVMADEVAVHAPHALIMLPDGTAAVDYNALGLAHLLEA